ncbi:hypothetical protein QQP08_024234 [Theobroma cacao]|nr:hypothetical protein QQP08_024234 [Theobroma cacao]
MAVPIQKVLLTGFIHSMHSEEIVDDQFYQPEAIKDPACLYCWRRGCIISLSYDLKLLSTWIGCLPAAAAAAA